MRVINQVWGRLKVSERSCRRWSVWSTSETKTSRYQFVHHNLENLHQLLLSRVPINLHQRIAITFSGIQDHRNCPLLRSSLSSKAKPEINISTNICRGRSSAIDRNCFLRGSDVIKWHIQMSETRNSRELKWNAIARKLGVSLLSPSFNASRTSEIPGHCIISSRFPSRRLVGL